MKASSPAAARNREPIARVLRDVLPERGLVLEVASGTGEHSVHLARYFRDLTWQCPLQRDGEGGWRCDGELRSGDARPMRLGIDLATAFTDVVLRQGEARLEVHRQAAAPDRSANANGHSHPRATQQVATIPSDCK